MTWQIRDSRYLYQSRWYNLRQDEITLPGGDEITYTLIEHPGYAMVVPLLPDGRVVMERVYRHTVGKSLLECPSGGLDGEPPAIAARRELEEETGFLAESVEPLGTYYGSSGISDEQFHLFLARDVSEGGTVALESTEQIEVELFALDDLVGLARRGELSDGPSALAILLTHTRLLEN
ncbi:MAG: NUDIX hydrolase [bacterium]|nr:NUDIX hydrolase [bacterium]